MKLAEKIMTLRKQRGWSQEELAQQLSVSRQSVSKWESGASVPDLDKILKMSEIFGVSTDTLLKEEMELNERKTTFEDLQNEQMKTDTSGMTNFVVIKIARSSNLEKIHEVKKFQRIMFLCRRQGIILNGQNTKPRGSH